MFTASSYSGPSSAQNRVHLSLPTRSTKRQAPIALYIIPLHPDPIHLTKELTKVKAVKVIAALLILVVAGGMLALNMGKKVDVTWTTADFNSAMAKTKINIDNIENINLERLALGQFTTSGRVSIDESFTSAEVTALIASANENSGPIRDTKVKFGTNGEGEVSSKLTKEFIDRVKNDPNLRNRILAEIPPQGPTTVEQLLVAILFSTAQTDLTGFTVDLLTGLAAGKPIYASGRVARTSSNSVEINVTSVRVGMISLPADTLRTVEYHTERFINNLISPDNGFDIQELHVVDGQLYYRGTLPAEIRGTQLP